MKSINDIPEYLYNNNNDDDDNDDEIVTESDNDDDIDTLSNNNDSDVNNINNDDNDKKQKEERKALKMKIRDLNEKYAPKDKDLSPLLDKKKTLIHCFLIQIQEHKQRRGFCGKDYSGLFGMTAKTIKDIQIYRNKVFPFALIPSIPCLCNVNVSDSSIFGVWIQYDQGDFPLCFFPVFLRLEPSISHHYSGKQYLNIIYKRSDQKKYKNMCCFDPHKTPGFIEMLAKRSKQKFLYHGYKLDEEKESDSGCGDKNLNSHVSEPSTPVTYQVSTDDELIHMMNDFELKVKQER